MYRHEIITLNFPLQNLWWQNLEWNYDVRDFLLSESAGGSGVPDMEVYAYLPITWIDWGGRPRPPTSPHYKIMLRLYRNLDTKKYMDIHPPYTDTSFTEYWRQHTSHNDWVEQGWNILPHNGPQNLWQVVIVSKPDFVSGFIVLNGHDPWWKSVDFGWPLGIEYGADGGRFFEARDEYIHSSEGMHPIKNEELIEYMRNTNIPNLSFRDWNKLLDNIFKIALPDEDIETVRQELIDDEMI